MKRLCKFLIVKIKFIVDILLFFRLDQVSDSVSIGFTSVKPLAVGN